MSPLLVCSRFPSVFWVLNADFTLQLLRRPACRIDKQLSEVDILWIKVHKTSLPYILFLLFMFHSLLSMPKSLGLSNCDKYMHSQLEEKNIVMLDSPLEGN